MKVIISIVLIILLPILCKSQLIINKDGKYEITKLIDWDYRINGTNTTIISKHTSFLDPYQENLQVDTFSANGMNLDLVFQNYIKRDFPKSFDDYELVSERTDTICGLAAKWLICKNTDFGEKFEDLVVIVVKNNTVFFIICLAREQDFEQFKGSFIKMIKTLKI